MIANTYSASQREAQQTRSGLRHTNAKRTAAGGFGDSPTSGRSRFPARENERTAYSFMRVHITVPCLQIQLLHYRRYSGIL